jgi:hypothetical protein
MKNKILIISTIFLFIGCAIPSKNIVSSISNPTKDGMIVGTISLEDRKSTASGHYFFFGNDSIKKKIALKEYDAPLTYNSTKWKYGLIIRNSKGNFKEGKKDVYLFNIVKPAGKYSFYELEIFLNSGYMQSTLKMPIDLPFEIEAGKTKYIGEINLKVKKGQIQIIDNITRDRIKFKEKFPNIVF